jgi:hypothetical protein
MSNDHFVAQTYLRHFGDPSRGGIMHAYRKSKGDDFPCYPKDVCHEWDGDTNPLLSSPRILADYRKLFEPKWRLSVATLLQNSLSAEDKFAISGYFANLLVCTPAWIRVCSSLVDQSAIKYLSAVKRMSATRAVPPDVPVEAIEMLERGSLTLRHDPNFVKGILSRQLLFYAWQTYHQDWIIIRNNTEFPFITSDNPVSIDQPEPFLPARRFLPITPELCLSIAYERREPPTVDPSLAPLGRLEWRIAEPQTAKEINTLTTKCAEELVFNNRPSSVVKQMVQDYARFALESEALTIHSGPHAEYQQAGVRVRERRK